jgi:hypothetical protein
MHEFETFFKTNFHDIVRKYWSAPASIVSSIDLKESLFERFE